MALQVPDTRKGKTASLGVYPETSLKKARVMHQDARRALAEGIGDPVEVKRTLVAAVTDEHSFQSVALEWVVHSNCKCTGTGVVKNLSRVW